MEPKYKKPLLERLHYSTGDLVLPFEEWAQELYYGNDAYLHGTPEERALTYALKGPGYFDAGVLPEIIIKPPKDNAVNKAKTMIPNKELRNLFYNSIGKRQNAEDTEYDSRLFVNRMWDIYKKSQNPGIRGLASGSRAFYAPLLHNIYVDPDYAADNAIAELSHAYQYRGTDTPRTWTWMKQFLSRPNGDMNINGLNGYDTPGSKEYNAHKIIEPRFQMYVSNPEIPYDFIWKSILNAYNNKPRLIQRGSKINTYIP